MLSKVSTFFQDKTDRGCQYCSHIKVDDLPSFSHRLFSDVGKKVYFCKKSANMLSNYSSFFRTDSYIWDEGYPYPTEQERIIIFVSSCIESVAERLGCKTTEAYRRMERVGLIHDYIIPYYDTIHTESRENVTADIIETLEFWEKKKGVSQ